MGLEGESEHTIDTNLTDEEVKIAYENNADTNEFSDAEQTKLATVETDSKDDQTNAEIETGYNAQVSAMSQAEAEAGVNATIQRISALRIKQAIVALATGGILNIVEDLTPELGGDLDALTKNIVNVGYFKSKSALVAQSGTLRLAGNNVDSIVFRNGANNADYALTLDSNDNFNFSRKISFGNGFAKIGRNAEGQIHINSASGENILLTINNAEEYSFDSAKADFSGNNIIDLGSITFADAKNIIFNTTTGTKLGTSNLQKLGIWNADPVIQPSHIVDADGTLADITTKFNTLLAQHALIGLQASS